MPLLHDAALAAMLDLAIDGDHDALRSLSSVVRDLEAAGEHQDEDEIQEAEADEAPILPSPDAPTGQADAGAYSAWLADIFNALELLGQDIEDLAHDADDELDGSGWNIARNRAGHWSAVRDAAELAESVGAWQLLEAGGERAPKGGVTIAGTFFQGGRFIPAAAMANASPEDKQRLEAAKAGAAQKAEKKATARQERGSVDTGKLANRLRAHADAHPLSKDEKRWAASAARMLHRHHGAMTAHRIEELADRIDRALHEIDDDHPNSEGLRSYFGKQLAKLHQALGHAQDRGVTGEVVKQVMDTSAVGQTGDPSGGGSGGAAGMGAGTSTSDVPGRTKVGQPASQGGAGFKVGQSLIHTGRAGRLDVEFRGFHTDPESGKKLARVIGRPETGPPFEMSVPPEELSAAVPAAGGREAGPKQPPRPGDVVSIPAHGTRMAVDVKFFPGRKPGEIGVGWADQDRPQSYMPDASASHFVNDLSGRVDGTPDSGNSAVDAVTSGKAAFLGKGDDGLVFSVNGKAVKVSTTVPFQPFNPGHRSPAEAAARLEQQAATNNMLADKGVPGVLRQEVVRHGDKAFAIRPLVDIPDKLTPEQISKVRRSIDAIHDIGYVVGDDVQVGLIDGEPYLFDLGKSQKARDHDDYADDSDRFERFAAKMGGEVLPLKKHAEKQLRDHEELGDDNLMPPGEGAAFADRMRKGIAASASAASAKGTSPDQPGFTGTDAQGRQWQDGKLVAKQEETTGAGTSSPDEPAAGQAAATGPAATGADAGTGTSSPDVPAASASAAADGPGQGAAVTPPGGTSGEGGQAASSSQPPAGVASAPSGKSDQAGKNLKLPVDNKGTTGHNVSSGQQAPTGGTKMDTFKVERGTMKRGGDALQVSLGTLQKMLGRNLDRTASIDDAEGREIEFNGGRYQVTGSGSTFKGGDGVLYRYLYLKPAGQASPAPAASTSSTSPPPGVSRQDWQDDNDEFPGLPNNRKPDAELAGIGDSMKAAAEHTRQETAAMYDKIDAARPERQKARLDRTKAPEFRDKLAAARSDITNGASMQSAARWGSAEEKAHYKASSGATKLFNSIAGSLAEGLDVSPTELATAREIVAKKEPGHEGLAAILSLWGQFRD